MLNISETIEKSTQILQLCGITEPGREANSLLSLAIKRDRAFLIAHSEYELSREEEILFDEFIRRRSQHEPFQHIAGKQEFCGMDFIVTPDVMIPRPETELIVEAGLKILRDLESQEICEVGIGSGCISVSILSEMKNAQAIGLDISEKALVIAGKNAERHGVLSRLDLEWSDVFEVLSEDRQFDLVVSNPPYVPRDDVKTLQAEVRDFDPRVALTDGKNGLSIIKKIIDESPIYLKPTGFLLMEMGFNQSYRVREMFSSEVWKLVNFFSDLQGIPRMVKAQLGE